MHGIMKNIPGPLAPPFNRRPNRNMTTRSYSWTTLIQRNNDTGRVATTRATDRQVRKMAQRFVVLLVAVECPASCRHNFDYQIDVFNQSDRSNRKFWPVSL